MKYLKMLGLVAVAAAALMAFVGASTASATVICSTTTTPCNSLWPNNSTVDFSLVNSALLKEPGPEGSTINTCTESTVKGTLTQGTSTTVTKGAVAKENLTWGKCNFPTTTTVGGTLTISNITGSSNGTVKGDGFRVTMNTFFFGTCIYGTGEGGHLGVITEGNPGIFHAEAVVLKQEGSGGLCPEKAEWNATYQVTEPKNTTLVVEPS